MLASRSILATTEKFGDPGSYFARLKLQVSLAKDATGLKGAETIISAVRHLKLKTGSDSCLVIIDTKARATAGDNENDGADMSSFTEKRQGYIARETDACLAVQRAEALLAHEEAQQHYAKALLLLESVRSVDATRRWASKI